MTTNPAPSTDSASQSAQSRRTPLNDSASTCAAPPATLGAARTLALTRIVACLVIATSADVHGAARFAGLASELVHRPSPLTLLIPIGPEAAHALRWLVVFAALVGAAGAYARSALSLLSVLSFMLLSLPQRVGAVTHCHHLVWVATLLAVSPCADVWSADAYFEPRRLRAPEAYTVPLAALRATCAAIYFFPGLHKLLMFAQGTEPGAWMLANLHWKWLQAGSAPPLPFVLTPAWALLLALGAVLFELAMPVLVSFRRTRPIALGSAILFHLATSVLLFIRFETLLAILISLVDLGPSADTPDGALKRTPRFTRWVCGSLLAGIVTAGLFGFTQGYPFACYPTFASAPPPTMPSARVELISRAGRCALPRPRTNPEWVQAFRIAGAYGDPPSPSRARAYVTRALQTRGSVCALREDSLASLTLEALAWDDASGAPRVVAERVVYEAAVSALGSAPAVGASQSSSPPR